MTTTNDTAIAGAWAHARARDELGVVSVDPEREARDRLRSLATINPAIGVAEGLLAVVSAGVAPVDAETLAQSGEAFTSFGDALAHYVAHTGDGVGLTLGPQPDGSARVAVQCTAASWNAWTGEHGTEVRDQVDDDGRVVGADRSYRDVGRHLKIHWSPGKVQTRSSVVAIGRAALLAAGEAIRTDRAGVGETGWAVWSVAGNGTERLVFKDKALDHGVQLLGSGVVPMAAHRRDGWSLTYSGSPYVHSATEFPAWLVSAFGGTRKVAKS